MSLSFRTVRWDELPGFTTRADAVRAAVEEGRQAGYDDGYRAGVESGCAAAEAERAAFGAAAGRALKVLAEAAAQVHAMRVQSAAEAADALAAAAVDIAEAVLGRVLREAESPGADALARALALVPSGCAVRVHMHPDDAALVGDVFGSVEIVADASIARGGCVAEGEDWSIDAQIAPAVERVRKVLLG